MNDHSSMPELIIDRPELQPKVQRTLFQLLTIVAWSAYLYLWLPLVTLGAWWLGVSVGWRELAAAPAPFVDVDLFVLLIEAAALAILIMVGWAEYNRLRFQGHERRGPRPVVPPEQSAAAFGVAPEVAQRLRESRHATLMLDDSALATGVEVHRRLDDAPAVRVDV